MNSLALRSDALDQVVDFGAETWAPEDAPLAMPRQSLTESQTAAARVATTPVGVGRRRMVLAGATLLITVLAAVAPFILYARKGFDPL
jgi:membrane glycosyltransferase